ncbi:MAG: type II toxin-antitoxin system RelE/ParE family toxin [Parabacteroides sp.]|nr:type II toxin-antitoxin system RelE/ParE family toxin [Parabacteroides sp.]
MSKVIIHHETFDREFKRLSKRYCSLQNDVEELIDELEESPLLGVSLGGGVRKVRMAIASKRKGKSHGARVITHTEAIVCADEEGVVTLLTIYDKADRDSISSEEIAALLKSLSLSEK